MALIYVAHPIDSATDKAARYAQTIQQLRRVVGDQHILYVPSRAWMVGTKSAVGPELQQVNTAALQMCEVLIVIIHDKDASTGCGIEIEQALAQAKRVVVSGGDHSFALASYKNHPLVTFVTEEQLLEWTFWPAWFFGTMRTDGTVKINPAGARPMRWAGAGEEPTRAYPHDAGFDLTYHGFQDIVIRAGECEDVPAHVIIEWPIGMWGFLVGRSSTFRTRGLLVNPAIIDTGFRGELFAIVRNISTEDVTIHPGERIAQVVPLPNMAQEVYMEHCTYDDLDMSERGAAGFGSSGT